MRELELPVDGADGHRWHLLARVPPQSRATLLWLPALGVAARHYLPLADALAAQGIAVFLHEWRGHGSSDRRASRTCNWGYRELLGLDLPASEAAMAAAVDTGPRILGGHSLGGQLACCRMAMAPEFARTLWLVASGSPYWRAFPLPHRYMLPLAYRFLPWLARRCGALPGRRIGFGGKEARGVIADWARSALSGRYATRGLSLDLEAAMAGLSPDVRAVNFSDDWLAPPSSLRFLLQKMPAAQVRTELLDAARLGARADHFTWMNQPGAVVAMLTANH